MSRIECAKCNKELVEGESVKSIFLRYENMEKEYYYCSKCIEEFPKRALIDFINASNILKIKLRESR